VIDVDKIKRLNWWILDDFVVKNLFPCLSNQAPTFSWCLITFESGVSLYGKQPFLKSSSQKMECIKPNHLTFKHYNNMGLFCDPNIIANNKERCFWNLAVANHNTLQILKLLRYHNIRTRTIASPSQLPNLIQSQNFSDYNCFYPLFAINTTSETICSKPITATI
jgi:hypothetical protein